MRAEALTPADIFGYHVRYVVPLFQRPYVWNRYDQWQPLWEDVRAVAERLLAVRRGVVAPHFLGAIVVEQAPTLVGSVAVYHVIDGQQRLTTLQLLLDAARRVIEQHTDGRDGKGLRQLVFNETAVRRDDEVYKVWPTLGDRDAYVAAMSDDGAARDGAVISDGARMSYRAGVSAGTGVSTGAVSVGGGVPDSAVSAGGGVPDGALSSDGGAALNGGAESGRGPESGVAASQIAAASVAQAHAYFREAITAWARVDADHQATTARLDALARAASDHLRAVVIHLDPGDNAQGIFETLNHRGAPLLAADLIKNLVFRIAQTEGLDVIALYESYWADLDGVYWRSYVRRGRQVVPRIDIFVNYWLIMRLGREVRTDQIFTVFRDHLLDAGTRVEDLLAELARDARTFEAVKSAPADTVPGRFCYRVLNAMETGAVSPFYLWLMRWSDDRLPIPQRDRALWAVESWVVRRWLCAMASKDTSNLVLELLQALDAAGPERAGDVTEAFLLAQRSASRVWPSDHAVKNALKSLAIDARVVRPRLRMLLEAIEDKQRTEKSEGPPCERDLTVEHVMPLAWRHHWAPATVEPAAAVVRDTLVHTLGNLTLVRWKLNEALANLPWTDAEAVARGLGPTGKRSALSSHSLLKINADLVAEDHWTEQAIAERTASLAAVTVAVWPRPPSPAPEQAGKASASEKKPASEKKKVVVSGARQVDATVQVDATAVAGQVDATAVAGRVDATVVAGQVETPIADEVDAARPRGKYGRLIEFLEQQTATTLPMSFEQLEDVMGDPLPPSARTSIPYWSRTRAALGAAIASGGYQATNVDLWNERVIFSRSPARRPQPARRRSGRRGGKSS
jgi:hypothetical protein